MAMLPGEWVRNCQGGSYAFSILVAVALDGSVLSEAVLQRFICSFVSAITLLFWLDCSILSLWQRYMYVIISKQEAD
jgi:hypothetical protein